MVEITYQMVLSTLQTVGILVGIIYYLIIMRNSQRTRELTLQSQDLTRKAQEQALETRQAQLFMQIFTRQYDIDQRRSIHLVNSLEYEDYEDFNDKYGVENDPDAYFRMASLGTYFEGVGVLVKRNLVDPSMVDDLMSGRIIDFWEAVGPYFFELRERTGDYEALEHVEYLYDVIKSIQDKQRIEAGLPIRKAI